MTPSECRGAVLIVGAGPTGLVLALALARRGVALRIVDQEPGPGEASRAMVVQARTLEFYRQLGIADDVVAGGVAMRRIRLRRGGKELGQLRISEIGEDLSAFPYVLCYPQDDHERLLVEKLRDAGVEVEWNVELTGQMTWNLDVFEQRTVSSPIAAGGMLFGSTGSGGGGNYLVAVKPGASPEEAYRVKGLVPYVPTSVADDELMYLFNDKGIASAMELATGEIVWQERIGGEFSGSPILIGDRILMVNDAGEALVLKAGREFELLGTTSLGQPTRATPAVANGRIYFRTDSKLLCLPGEKT
jgi:hypothetical protein